MENLLFIHKFCIGKKYAIIGESGSGKSILVKLLLGMLKPKSGEIFYDEKNIKDIDISKIATYISQDIFIYNASGMDNVTLFDYKHKKDLDYYIDLLKVRELMERNLGELGRNISGGEKNRIAILRALNMETKIIVLDESLANLDELNKKEITDFLLGLKDIMIILITHDYDEDYLNKFDEIIKMEKGKVKEIKKNMKI